LAIPISSVLEEALEIARLGIPVDLFPSGVKKNTNPEWQLNCTTDLNEIVRRAEAEPHKTNYSMVAKAQSNGFVFLDDDGGIRAEYEKVYGKLSPTRKHQSCGGAFHYIFKHSVKSLAFQKEIDKAYIGETKSSGGELWSLRMHNAYILGPKSVATSSNGVTGEYKAVYKAPVVEIPDTLLEFLIARWKAAQKKVETKSSTWLDDPIPEGERNTKLFKIACALRNAGLDEDSIYAAMSVKNEKQCVVPISDEELKTLCHSAAAYKPKPNTVLVGGKIAGSEQPQTASVSSGMITKEQLEALVDRSAIVKKPIFPEWTMADTSIYRNLVQPALKTSNKISYLIFMPTIVAYMNYLSTKIQLKGLNAVPMTMFLGSIACKGTYKSSCAELGFRYLNTIGISDDFSSRISNANGKQLLFTVGSTEALGIRMEQVRCRNAVLYYDELRKASKKMGIDNSSFSSDLITVYESGKFANDIKETKKSFYHAPGTYCVSWIFCSTIKAFNEVWPRIILNNSDLLDRMFFVLGPEKVSESDEANLYTDPDFMDTCSETRQLIDKALEQKIYDYEDYEEAKFIIKNELAGLTTSDIGDGEDSLDLSMSRLVGLTQKLALFFAVDLGLASITGECLERATALVKYRCAVIRYLRPIEADSVLGRLQQLMIHTIRSNQGQMLVRQWKRLCHYDRYDTELWFRAQKGLIQTGKIRLDTLRAATGHDHNTVTLLKDRD